MRSRLSVRRPHIRTQVTNRRKNLGRAARSQYNQFRQWLQTAVLPDPVSEKRALIFAALALPETETVQVSKSSKKSDKKKSKKDNAKQEEAVRIAEQKKAAEREARRVEAEAKKRAAEEEEHRRWKAEQEKIEIENAKKEEEVKQLKAQQKKANKSKKSAQPAVEEEVIVKKVEQVQNAAPAPTPKSNKSEPAPAEPVKENSKKSNKKNKKNSESEKSAPAPVEEPKQVEPAPEPVVVEEVAQVAEPVAEKVSPVLNETQKSSKKDKKKSESEAQSSTKPTADDLGFLDFVTPKNEEPETQIVVETAQTAPGNKNKNKKNKKNSESDKTSGIPPVEQLGDPNFKSEFITDDHVVVNLEPIPLPKTIDVGLLEEPLSNNEPAGKKNKKNKKNSESESQSSTKPIADDLGFLDFVTPKKDVEEIIEAPKIETPVESAPTPAASKKNKKNKKNSESENVTSPISAKPTADNLDFLDFVTPKKETSEEPLQKAEPVQPPKLEDVDIQELVGKSAPEESADNKKSKKNKKNKKNSESESSPVITSEKPTAENLDFLDFVTPKKETSEEPLQKAEPVQPPKLEDVDIQELVGKSAPEESADNKKSKKNKKNKKNSESENTPSPTSANPTAENLDFLDFVTPKKETVEEVVEAPKIETPVESAPTPAASKKNKKNKKNSESETAPIVVSEKPIADDLGFLDFVTAKKEKSVEAEIPAKSEQQEAPASGKKNKKNKKSSESESSPVPAVETSAPVSSKKNKKNSESDKTAGIPPVEQLGDPNFKSELISEDHVVENLEPIKPPTSINARDVLARPHETHSKKNKKNKHKKHADNSVSPQQTEEDLAFLEFLAAGDKKAAESSNAFPSTEEEKEFVKNVQKQMENTYQFAEPVQPPKVDNIDIQELIGSKPKKSQNKKKNAEAEVPLNTQYWTKPADDDLDLEEYSNQNKKTKVSQKPTADTMDFLDFVTAKPEKVVEAAPEPVQEQPKPASNKPTADTMDFLDFVTAKPEKVEEEPVVAAPTHVEPTQEAPTAAGNKKNKNKKNKNKKNSESEAAPAVAEAQTTQEVVEEVFEKKIVAPSTEEKKETTSKNKKNKKKGSGNSESKEVVIPAAETTTEGTFVEIPSNEPIVNGTGSPSSDKENATANQTVISDTTNEASVGATGGNSKKNKKNKNKKNKNSNSISLQEDDYDNLADAEVQAITGGSDSPPLQVHEVTSTLNGGVEQTTTTIQVTQALGDSKVSPTQFQKNVESLVQATLAKQEFVKIDPTVKLQIDAQLIRLAEKKAPAVVMEHKNYIKPLPLELHISRPSTPSRDRLYKLLPKDILFCAGLIDTYGEDYAAMVNDSRNVFKENSRALQRKIRIFKDSPHFQTYLRAKEENRPLEDVIANEAIAH